MILIIVLLFFGNDGRECFKNIQKGRISVAYTQYKSLVNQQNDYFNIANAYFSRNSVTAISTYQKIFEHTKIAELKSFTKKKLYEYYYATGLYKRAQFYQSINKSDLDHNSKKNSPYFLIQMGVFSAESNALALKQKIRKVIKRKTRLKKELREGLTVIIVNVGPFNSRDIALKQLNNLRDRLGLSGWIKEVN